MARFSITSNSASAASIAVSSCAASVDADRLRELEEHSEAVSWASTSRT